MSKERSIIFNSFAIGLIGNLCTVLATCLILMDSPVAEFACIIVLFTTYHILTNSRRIQNKFILVETDTTKLNDLTHFSNLLDNQEDKMQKGGNFMNRKKSPIQFV
jgi:hypothetical protein